MKLYCVRKVKSEEFVTQVDFQGVALGPPTAAQLWDVKPDPEMVAWLEERVGQPLEPLEVLLADC